MDRYLIYLGLQTNSGDRWGYLEALDIIIEIASEIGITGFTAYQTIGMWRGTSELSIRLEIFDCPEQLAIEYALLLKDAFHQETVGLVTDKVHRIEWI
jgi:hypothetical protein